MLSVCASRLKSEVAVVYQPFFFVSSVPSVNVASSVRLEVPRGDQDDVADTDPDSSLQLAPNSAQPFLAVFTLHQHSVKTQHLDSCAQYIVGDRQFNVPKIIFADDFSLTRFVSPLC